MDQFWSDLVLRLGFPVVVVLAMIKGYLVPGFIYDRVVKENDRLTVVTEEKVIPLAVESQRLLREALIILEEAGLGKDGPDDPRAPRSSQVRR